MKKSPIITAIAIIAIILIILFTSQINKGKEEAKIKNIETENNMKLSSPTFQNNQRIPEKYTCEGEDINPSLEVSEIPRNAKSLVLIVDDPDAPVGTWDHWILFNIPTNTTKIEEDSIPKGATQGKNSWNKNNYGGPCPPSGTHRYFFKLYALDKILNLDKNAKKSEIEKAMQNYILAKAELVGLYSKTQ